MSGGFGGGVSVPPFIQRLIDEEKALKQKIDSLESFLGSNIHAGLSTLHKTLLAAQLDAMKAYHKVLALRSNLHVEALDHKPATPAAPDITEEQAAAGILEIKTTASALDADPLPFEEK